MALRKPTYEIFSIGINEHSFLINAPNEVDALMLACCYLDTLYKKAAGVIPPDAEFGARSAIGTYATMLQAASEGHASSKEVCADLMPFEEATSKGLDKPKIIDYRGPLPKEKNKQVELLN